MIKTLETELKVQKAQIVVLGGETKSGAELFQQYGFTSAPHADCEAVGIPIGGKSNHIVIVATEDRRYRPIILKQGEVALYTDEGDIFHFKRGQEVGLTTKKFTAAVEDDASIEAGGKATLKGDEEVILEGAITRLGAAGANQKIIIETFMTLFNGHVHEGVQAGSGTSGVSTTQLGASHMTTTVRVKAN